MILFCLPYAGGSKVVYYKWKNYLDFSIYLDAIELKGRGTRYEEDFYENLEEAVDDIFNNIKDKIKDNEYAIFGHSMGSLLAYELYYKIVSENCRKPKHIFFSGYRCPTIKNELKKIYLLEDDKFMDEITELGGTPKEVLENKELIELVRPILRNDFKLIWNYVHQPKDEKIECNISVLNGNDDTITLEELQVWKNECSRDIKLYNFTGGHFFINDHMEKIIEIINETLI